MPHTILLVDGDPVQSRLLEAMVRRLGCDSVRAESGGDALELLRSDAAGRIDLVILDLTLPDMGGVSFLQALGAKGGQPPAIVQALPGSLEAIPAAMQAGALDFLSKPVAPERLQVSVKNALRLTSLEKAVRRSGPQGADGLSLKDFGSRTVGMDRVTRLAERAARSANAVLIEGEPGTGKRTLARMIQASSDRRGRPFVTVACAAIPEASLEAVLFGFEKGSPAGAGARSRGKIAEAHRGTLLLTDIDALPQETQAKLLLTLQEGQVRPLGSRKAVRVDVRVVSTTRENLLGLVQDGRFREDLYYRLNVLPIALPPLRARREDVADLAMGFLARFAAEQGKRIRGFSAEALALLSHYAWPGNIRELENTVFRAVALAAQDEVTLAELPQIASRVQGFEIRIPPAATSPEPPIVREVVRVEMRDPDTMSLLDQDGEMRRLEELEAEIIRFALAHYGGHMSEASRRLGIGRSTLYRKLKDFGWSGDAGHAAA